MSVDYDYAEGGGRLPPYKESFFENIVGVSWHSTGGIFVSGDFCCYQRAARMEKNDSPQNWVPLGTLQFTPGGGTFASTYAKIGNLPTFVIGGHDGNRSSIIMRSHDGLKWEFVWRKANEGIESLVWDPDEKRFYAWYGDENSLGKLCYYSPDGLRWFQSLTYFDDHCKGFVRGVADGVYGYDPANDILIFPGSPLHGQDLDAVGLAQFLGVYVIVDASTKFAQIYKVDTGLRENACVAYVGGIWIAAGTAPVATDLFGYQPRSGTATSIDGGANWEVVSQGPLKMSGDWDVTTVIGAPIQHFKSIPSSSDAAYKYAADHPPLF